MASSFDRWEKDPFFSAAEEVQESADRMESAYRTWMHAKQDASSLWNCDELRRDLRTALGTTKWQLEEFAQAVKSSFIKSSNEDARDRHHDFIIAMEDQISKIESSLQESGLPEGKRSLPWVHLDEAERNELALFLSTPSTTEDASSGKNYDRQNENQQLMEKESAASCSYNSQNSTEWGSVETKEEKLHRHRRTASASADIGAWEIVISNDNFQQSPSKGHMQQTVRKIPSFSGFLSSVGSASKIKWSKNGIRKWRAVVNQQEADTALLQSQQLTSGMNASLHEKSKSCLDGRDDYYDKQFHGWYGALQRQLQRSQYQMQCSRPVQLTVSVFLLLIVFATIHMV